MASLITISEYKTWARIPSSDTSQDTLLTFLADAVSKDMRRWCDRDETNGFELTSRTEQYDGTGEETIQLAELPVVSITSVSVLYADGSSDILDANSYRVDEKSGVLSRIDARRSRYPVSYFGNVDSIFAAEPRFPSGFDNIEVVYTAGYSPIPADIKMAALRLMDMAYAAGGRNPNLASESIGGYSYSNQDPKAYTSIKAEITRLYNTLRI